MSTAVAEKTVIRPIDDRVLVKPDEGEEKTASGIYLPEGARDKPMQGTIVAAGPGRLNDDGERTALTVQVGQTVVYGKYSGTEVELNGEQHMIMREAELLAILED